RVHDYGGFLWAELDDAQRRALDARGIAWEAQPEARQLQVGAYRFDPLVNATPVPAADTDSGRGLRLVQFPGPTRQAWLDRLAADGLVPLQYYPHNAYLVWGERDARQALARHDFVRWHDGFHAGYRIAADLAQRSGRIDNVMVVFYNDGDIE